ncbi:DNA repair protein RecN [Paraferrimonas haliotis]|uniref:DNA repair protein RecN n=1 Tax=Paraferrimonas haliotis TaxID=2013866 RepID=A0AA37TQ82_9GAMM|nr:DNA repair protein RecN [Paraferrimonas haliotis]GLS83648.1 DNA repair protein RecN [Paraferrimonas haliotis]
MLTQLTVQNFAIVKFLELDLKPGMTSITGETGAGKSIAIDALGLCLGRRAEASMVRSEQAKAEVCARFELMQSPNAKKWLMEHDLDDDDDCIVRRVVNSDGRSRAYINGAAVTLSQLKQLGNLLVNLHGQHAHLALAKPDNQLQLLDDYCNHSTLIDTVRTCYQDWHTQSSNLQALRQSEAERHSRLQLLSYQVDELEQFDCNEHEYQQLVDEHKTLANGTQLIESSQRCLALTSQDPDVNIENLLNQAVSQATALCELDKSLENVAEMLNSALIQVQESSGELDRYQQALELDPQRLQWLESRLGQFHELARKHQVRPEEVYQTHQQLAQEVRELGQSQQQLQDLEQAVAETLTQYHNAADKLHQSRIWSAKKLAKQVTAKMRQLNMENGVFAVELNRSSTLTKLGNSTIEFQVTTNPGQPLQALGKVASGGELSRIGLALQVLTSGKVATPTLIFDEVDTGISGATAAVVGNLLRELGEQTQVLCVTHLPQVAGQGHQQMKVDKISSKGTTHTQIAHLNKSQRLQELARLLAGDEITEVTLANAQQLLAG